MSRYIAASEYEKFVQFLYYAVRKADQEIANLTTIETRTKKANPQSLWVAQRV